MDNTWYSKYIDWINNTWFSKYRFEKYNSYMKESASFVGAFPIRQDITVLPADNPSSLRLGWVIYEEVGVVITNNYAIARVTLDLEHKEYPLFKVINR